jgi:DNA-directed RNA polymerase subunit M/transcription elongation factor TFIIS
MEPKTKIQKRVVELMKSLPLLIETQRQWGIENVIPHIAKVSKKGITCLKCGHTWKEGDAKTCPNCGVKLIFDDTKKRIFKDIKYYLILNTCEEFQVLRYFVINSVQSQNKEADYQFTEVMQRWIKKDGEDLFARKLTNCGGCYFDLWNYSSKIEIRNDNDNFRSIYPEIYPKYQILPELKRNGFKGSFHKINPYHLFKALLSNSKAETIFKAKQFNLLSYFNYLNIDKLWKAIKICIRNNYIVKDASLWRDYINILIYLGKDISNAKYVCPEDLSFSHEEYLKLYRNKVNKERDKARFQRMKEYEAKYKELKQKYFDFEVSQGTTQIRVLKSVKEFEEESKELGHCVFDNEYFLIDDSLILSASVGGKKMETIEISLSEMKIIQCRGKMNKNSKHHKAILNLMRTNLPLLAAIA